MQKLKLIVLTILCLNCNYGQTFVKEPTVVDSGNYVFSENEFNKLLFKLDKVILEKDQFMTEITIQDSIITVQDSLIISYQELSEKRWLQNLIYSFAGYLLQFVVKI